MRSLLIPRTLLWLLSGSLPAGAALLAPSELTALVTGPTTITLTWKDNSDNETKFIIGQRIPPATTFSSLGSLGANSTTVGLINRKPGTNYEFAVIAADHKDMDPAAKLRLHLGKMVDTYYATPYLNRLLMRLVRDSDDEEARRPIHQMTQMHLLNLKTL